MSIGQELAKNSRKTGVPQRCPNPNGVFETGNSFGIQHQFGCNTKDLNGCDKCVFNSRLDQETFYFTLKNGRYTLAK